MTGIALTFPARGGSAGRRSYVGAVLMGRVGAERHRRGPFFVPNTNTNEGTCRSN